MQKDNSLENAKSCPFCGGDVEIYCEENMYKPRCKNTYTCGCQIALWFDEPEDAVRAWNERLCNEER